MKRYIKELISKGSNLYTRVYEKHLTKGEVKKYSDDRRKAIYSTIELTSDQKLEIDELYEKNYGQKIPYVWHQHFTAFTGQFDKNYIPETLFIPEFERYMNLNKPYQDTMADKNFLPYVAMAAGVLFPKTKIACIDGGYVDSDYMLISKDDAIKIISDMGEAFVKPSTNSGSGHGCRVVNFENGLDIYNDIDANTFLEQMGIDFVAQERLTCHESIAALYPNSVNTFRVITYRWKDEILHMPIIMRIGQGGGNIDNAHAGGVFIAVDDDGKLHKTAFTEFKKSFTTHPDTGVVFEGYQIPNMDKIISSAKRLHSMVPQVGVYNWDFTINQDGEPVLVEANTGEGSIWMAQMSHGKGVFGERTEEVLRWIGFVKKQKPLERKQYAYGKMK